MTRGEDVKLKLKWESGRYASDRAKCGQFTLEARYSSSKAYTYEAEVPGINFRSIGHETMDAAKEAAETALRASLKQALAIIGEEEE